MGVLIVKVGGKFGDEGDGGFGGGPVGEGGGGGVGGCDILLWCAELDWGEVG